MITMELKHKIYKYLTDTDYMIGPHLPSELGIKLAEGGFNYRENGLGLLEFISQFNECFKVVPNASEPQKGKIYFFHWNHPEAVEEKVDIVHPVLNASELKKKVYQIFAQNWPENENEIHLPKVNIMLQTAGIDYKQYCAGFKDFLLRFDDFLSVKVCNTGTKNTVLTAEFLRSNMYPAFLAGQSGSHDDELRSFNEFAQIDNKPQFVSLLCHATGFSGTDTERWIQIVAERYMIARLENRFYELYEDQNRRVAFSLHMKNIYGHSLFIVFDGDADKTQKLKYREFCYPGQPIRGVWLYSCGVESDDTESLDTMKNQVQTLFEQLKSESDILTQKASILRDRIENKQRVPAELTQLINSYSENWDNLIKSLSAIYGNNDRYTDEDFSLESAKTILNDVPLNIEPVNEAVTLICTYIDSFISSNDIFNAMSSETADKIVESAEKSKEEVQERLADIADRNKIKESLDVLKNIVEIYRALDRIMSSPLNDVSQNDAELVAKYFGISSRGVIGFLSNYTDCSNASILEEALVKLLQCTTVADAPVSEITAEPIMTDTVSHALILAFNNRNDELSDEFFNLFLPLNEFEQLILYNNFADAASMAEDTSKMSQMGYDEQLCTNIKSALASKTSLPKELSANACATRFFEIQKNHNRQAEKYMLMSNFASGNSLGRLLSIYRLENRIADFLYVTEQHFEAATDDYPNLCFEFEIYRKDGNYSHIADMLEKYPELGYDIKNLTAIVNICENAQSPKALFYKQLLESNLFCEEENPFEQAVVCGDMAEASMLVSRPDIMEKYGYSADDIYEISVNMTKLDYQEMSGNTSFDIGRRIYAIQKNRFHTAEKYMWAGVTGRERYFRLNHILTILKDENRWEEICFIYELSEQEMSAYMQSRYAYFEALLHTDVDKAFSFARNYVADCLFDNRVAKLETISDSEDKKSLSQMISQFVNAVENEFEQGIILNSPELRTFVDQSERLKELKYSPEEIRHITSTFTLGNYSRGITTSEIGQRLFEFIANKNNLAEYCFMLAEESDNTIKHLINIYIANQRWDDAEKLINEHPDFENESSFENLQWLFYKKKYAQLCDMFKDAMSASATNNFRWKYLLSLILSDFEKNREEIYGLFDDLTLSKDTFYDKKAIFEVAKQFYAHDDYNRFVRIASFAMPYVLLGTKEEICNFISLENTITCEKMQLMQALAETTEDGRLLSALWYRCFDAGEKKILCENLWSLICSRYENSPQHILLTEIICPDHMEECKKRSISMVIRKASAAGDYNAVLQNITEADDAVDAIDVLKSISSAEYGFDYIVALSKLYEISGNVIGVEVASYFAGKITDNESANANLADIFYKYLSDESADSVIDFCRECAVFALHECAKEQLSGLDAEQLHELMKNNVDLFICYLSVNSQDVQCWEVCKELPLCAENTQMYANLLYICSRIKQSDWSVCFNYCAKNSLMEMFYNSLYEALKSDNTAVITLCQKYIVQHFKACPYDINSDNTQIKQLLANRICECYHKTITASAGLKSTYLFGVKTGTTKIILEKLEYELTEANPATGCAMVAFLLLSKQIDDALQAISCLKKNTNASVEDGLLESILTFGEMSKEQLEQYLDEPYVRDFLGFIDIGGNPPSYDNTISPYIIEKMVCGEVETAANAMRLTIKAFPNDELMYQEMFLLCKGNMQHKSGFLYESIYGTCKHSTFGKIKFDWRNYYEAMCLLAVSRKLLDLDIEDDMWSKIRFDKKPEDLYAEFYPTAQTSDISQYQDFCKQLDRKCDELHRSESLPLLLTGIATGSWDDIIKYSYENNLSMDDAKFIKNHITVYGLLRSIVGVYIKLDSQKRDSFREWLSHDEFICENIENAYLLNKALVFADSNYEIAKNAVVFPCEERNQFRGIFNNIIQNAAPEYDEESENLMTFAGVLAQNDSAQEIMTYAVKYFEDGKNSIAKWMAAVSCKLIRKFGCYIDNSVYPKPVVYERSESLMRVAGVFAGDTKILTKISKTNFSEYSCMNMVSRLLGTKRASEFYGMTRYFCSTNKEISELVYQCMCGKLSDDEKIELADSVSNQVVRNALLFAMSMRYWVSSPDKKAEAARKITATPRHTVIAIKPAHNIKLLPADSFGEVDLSGADANENVVAPPDSSKNVQVIPGYVKRAADEITDNYSDENENGNELYKEYKSMPTKEYRERSAILLRMLDVPVENVPIKKTQIYQLLGIEQYRYFSEQGKTEKVREILLETAHVAIQSQPINEFAFFVTNAFINMICSYKKLSDLTDDFTKYRIYFNDIKKVILMQRKCEYIDVLFDYIVGAIEADKNSAGSDAETAKYITQIIRKMSEVRFDQTWSKAMSTIRSLLLQETDRLTCSPRLKISVLNNDKCNISKMFGVVKNYGRMAAENVQLRVMFENVNNVFCCSIERIIPNMETPFCIVHSLPDSVNKIGYTIEVSFTNPDGSPGQEFLKGEFYIKRETKEFPMTVGYDIATITDFSLQGESGKIVSDGLVGRDDEKKKIENCYTGSFEQYSNLIVRGLRRAGKTSLLNYTKEFIRTFCDDAYAIKINCQGASAIHAAFVERVLDETEFVFPSLQSNAEYSAFREKWTGPDFDFKHLKLFYSQLSAFTENKHPVIILDEIDRLFDQASAGSGLDSQVFPELRSLMMDSDASKVVHFVFCGSDSLYKYYHTTGTLNELFWAFGTQIDVRGLRQGETETVLKKISENSDIEYTQEALDLIWEYTQGIIWYTKLLGQRILEILKFDNRNVVYPTDVHDAITKIVIDEFCLQLTDACMDSEKNVLCAMQKYTRYPGESVAKSVLYNELSGKMSPEAVDSALLMLEMLTLIVKQRPTEGGGYRFKCEVYRRYFCAKYMDIEDDNDAQLVFINN